MLPLSAPSGRAKEHHPNLGGTSYPISNVWDSFAKDTRTSLFIHCGGPTRGCIGIHHSECADFMQAMAVAKPTSITLVPKFAQF